MPAGLTEAAYALGAGQWRTVRLVTLPTVRSGLATAVILGAARAIGETAPVLLTSVASEYLTTNPFGKLNSLPLMAYTSVQEPRSGRDRPRLRRRLAAARPGPRAVHDRQADRRPRARPAEPRAAAQAGGRLPAGRRRYIAAASGPARPFDHLRSGMKATTILARARGRLARSGSRYEGARRAGCGWSRCA